MDSDPIMPYFSGEKLYGDDFTAEEIMQWFEDEKEGYSKLIEERKEGGALKDGLLNLKGQYGYHAMNMHHGYKYLPKEKLPQVLSIGGSFGDELLPIISRIENITILEPSEKAVSAELEGVPIEYVSPSPTGEMPFDDNRFDLITSFGVLHHIPNVSKVVGEAFRCLKPGGFALIVDPIGSLGDWRYPRQGLTKRERGIPVPIFKDIFNSCNFEIVNETLCMFSLIGRMANVTNLRLFNNAVLIELDKLLCRMFGHNNVYHATTFYQKLTKPK